MPPVPQEPAPVLSSPPPADVSTFLAFPSPEKLLRLGPKSSVLIAQQVTAPLTPAPRGPRLLELPERRFRPSSGLAGGGAAKRFRTSCTLV